MLNKTWRWIVASLLVLRNLFIRAAVFVLVRPRGPRLFDLSKRDTFKRLALTVGALVIGGPMVLLQLACNTKQLAKWTGVVINLLSELSPILTDMGATGIVGMIARALPIAQKLKEAFEKDDNVSALTLFDNLTNAQTGVIVEISNALGVLQGPQRKILLGIMAAASVFLRLIGANIKSSVTPADADKARKAMPGAVASMERAAEPDVFERMFAAVRL